MSETERQINMQVVLEGVLLEEREGAGIQQGEKLSCDSVTAES